MIDSVVQRCPIDTRRALLGNISLSGGTTMFKHFGQRIQVTPGDGRMPLEGCTPGWLRMPAWLPRARQRCLARRCGKGGGRWARCRRLPPAPRAQLVPPGLAAKYPGPRTAGATCLPAARPETGSGGAHRGRRQRGAGLRALAPPAAVRCVVRRQPAGPVRGLCRHRCVWVARPAAVGARRKRVLVRGLLACCPGSLSTASM